MNFSPTQVGDSMPEIETPALMVDLDAFERNLQKMAAFAKSMTIRLRPHAKTHRCPAIALKQMEKGAVGQCCQKVSEAEVLVRGGVRDVLLSNEVLDSGKLRRLAALAKIGRISLCFDAFEQVVNASRAAQEFGVDGEYAALRGSRGEPYEEFEQSLFVLTTVMSVAGEGRAILDAGLKSYSLEKGLPTIEGPNVGRLIRASDEHGTVGLAPGASLRLGAQIKLAPSHCDPTINLHDQYVCVRNDRVEAIWPISARGASS